MLKYRPLMFILGVLLLLLTACDAGREVAENTRDDGEVQATIWSEHKWYEEGEPIRLRFALTNITDETIILQRNDGNPVVDIVFSAEPTLRWSEGPGSERDLTRLVLEPNAHYVIEWTLPPVDDTRRRAQGVWWSLNLREESVWRNICQGNVGYC